MDLKHLTGVELEKSTVAAVRMEKLSTATVIAHIKEINSQKHFSLMGYKSSYDYLTRKHGYCAGSADRLIKSASIIAEVPGAQDSFIKGTLSLTNMARAQKFCMDHAIKDPVKKEEIIKKVEGKSKDQAESILFSLMPEDEKKYSPKDCKIRINEKQVRLSLTVKDQLIEKIQRYKDLSGKKISDGEVFELALDLLLETEENKKFKKVKKEIKITKSSPPAEKSGIPKRKAIPRPLQRKIYERANYQCEHCSSVKNLQINHKIPWALGGEDTFENLNLLCFHCNDRERIEAKLTIKPKFKNPPVYCGPGQKLGHDGS